MRLYRTTMACGVLLAGLIVLGRAADGATLTNREWKIDGTTRRALVHLPAKTEGAAIIFAFHGHGGTMNFAARRFRLHELWPEAIVVYPQGLPTVTPHDAAGKRAGWELVPGPNNRDLKLFDAMLETARRDWRITTNRVYVTGHSNGGGFTYELWGARGNLLAAVAPVAASGAAYLRQAKPCPVIHFAGRKDQLVDFESQERAVEAARRVNGTDAPVEFVVHNGGHAYPNDAPEKIIAFFKQHSRR
jgi:polyhydroxybutyrate depolymerase